MAERRASDSLRRAAIFLMSIGEEPAARVMKHLGAKDVQRLGTAMASVDNVTREQVEGVLDDFVATLDRQTAVGVASDDYVRKVLVGALGEDKARSLADRIFSGRSNKGLEALKWMGTRAVTDLIRNEHPQIVAIVLSYLDADQAAAILMQLPEEVRLDCLLRIATLEGVQPAALQELNAIMERRTTTDGGEKSNAIGGIKVAADILNLLDSSEESKLMKSIRSHDDGLGNRIEDLMFIFDDLAGLDDKSVQRLLHEVPSGTLAKALRGATAEVRNRMIANLSKHAAEILNEDMEASGPVRVADVEAAQKEILAAARQLADHGDITLTAKSDEYI